MRRTQLQFPVCWRLAACVTLLAAMRAPARNLIGNPGFDGDQGWSFRNGAENNGAVARIVPEQGRRDSPCLLLEQTKLLDLPEGWGSATNLARFIQQKKVGGFTLANNTVPVQEGHRYAFRFWFRSEGLKREDRDNPKQGYAAFTVFIHWMMGDDKHGIGGPDGTLWVVNEQVDARDWTEVVNRRAHRSLDTPYLAPDGAKFAQIRFQLATVTHDAKPSVWVDDVRFEDMETVGQAELESTAMKLANAGFEDGNGAAPKVWAMSGTAKGAWVDAPVHGGKKAVAVSDAGTGGFSGWSTEVTVESGAAYEAWCWAKGGDLTAYGPVPGGALCLQYVDEEGQPLGEPALSPTVAAQSDWQEVGARIGQVPAGASRLRLTVGLQYCKGTAWFDDVRLEREALAATTTAILRRADPRPSPGVTYAKNLLRNGDVEQGEGGSPAGWTYVGRAEKDWSDADIATFYRESRPVFPVGRGRGEWVREGAYAGSRALLNVSIDPPLSRNMQWYGRNPVDGFWLSDPMSCEAGKAYLASAWIRPGAPIHSGWYGPLEIRFYDAKGRAFTAASQKEVVRPGIDNAPAGVWTWWATLPFVAPADAVSMRLRFGQELSAAEGGWGRFFADNFAVWELPEGASAAGTQDFALRTEPFWTWFRGVHAKVKPPYVAAPMAVPEYLNCLGHVDNTTPGNLYHDPHAAVPVRVTVSSQLGELRDVALRVDRYDWVGTAVGSVEVPAFALPGYSDATTAFTMPAAGTYGAFFLEGTIREGDAVVGSFSGRYAVLPPLVRPKTVENIWGVTTLAPFFGDGRAEEKELGELLKTAGFGVSWLNLNGTSEAAFDKALREVAWWRSLGIRPVLRINNPEIRRPIDSAHFHALGRRIATAFRGTLAAYGNWGVEQADPRTPTSPVYRPILDGKMLTDEEYDTILAALYEGLKSVDPQTPVLIGNIAGSTLAIPRLYGKPAEGRFDGAILNGYMGVLAYAQTSLRQFDERGDTHKTVWKEEDAEQRSPSVGTARRYGEAEGPRNMVRVWLSMKALCGPRLKAKTYWGFVANSVSSDIPMVNEALQPRPQFVAHAVMADALADAAYVADRSQGGVTMYEWRRGDGPLWTLWANSGEQSVTFDAPLGRLTVMDLMGNRTEVPATDGIVSIKLTSSPVYVFGGGPLALGKRLTVRLAHGSVRAGVCQLRLSMENHGSEPVRGRVTFAGPVEGDPGRPFEVEPGATATLTVPVKPGLPDGVRTGFTAECRTSQGGVYLATAGLNFAQAVRTPTPPALDGTWSGWGRTTPIAFGKDDLQIFKGWGKMPDVKYKGPDDILGDFRMLWDDQFLYLGVAAADNSFFPQPERGMQGFMGDSIEFAVQPDNRTDLQAPYWEYELYLPGGQPPYAANRRLPLPAEPVSHWRATVKPTGERGNCVYQAAIPWRDLGVAAPAVGKTVSFALVLNDADEGQRMTGSRVRVKWFDGLDTAKNPEGFGDVTLVEPKWTSMGRKAWFWPGRWPHGEIWNV